MTHLLSRILIVSALALSACSHAPKPTASPSPAVRGKFADAPAFSDWSADCGRGDAGACKHLLSAVIFSGRGDLLTLGQDGFGGGCKAGVADACTGHLLATVNPEAPEGSLPGLRKACAEGSDIACLLEVPLAFEETTTGEEMFQLIELSTLRCEEAGGPTCSIVGNVYEQGAGASRDDARAAALYARGCETKDPASCFQHGQMLMAAAASDSAPEAEGAATAPESPAAAGSLTQARAAFTTACDGLMGPACYALAEQLFSGKGGAPDPARAREAAWRGCDLGDRTSCDFLAATNEGRTWPRPEGSSAYETPEAFAAMQRKYCAFGGGEACTALAFVDGAAAEESKSFEPMDGVIANLQRGCEAGVGRACAMLDKVGQDALRACDDGSEPAQCLVAGYALTSGTRVPDGFGTSLESDPARAEASFKKACEAGVQSACARVARPE